MLMFRSLGIKMPQQKIIIALSVYAAQLTKATPPGCDEVSGHHILVIKWHHLLLV